MKNQTIISLLCCLLLFVTGCSTSHQGNTYDIMTYGAKGDGQTDDAAAIQRAINACSAAGGGTVIIPAGHTFLCGPLYLKSYVNLHLEPNSRLLANPDESIYTESAFRENRGEGMMWISGKDLKQISITGIISVCLTSFKNSRNVRNTDFLMFFRLTSSSVTMSLNPRKKR